MRGLRCSPARRSDPTQVPARRAWDEFPQVLSSSSSVAAAIRSYIEQSRDEGLRAGGGGLALPLAERALRGFSYRLPAVWIREGGLLKLIT